MVAALRLLPAEADVGLIIAPRTVHLARRPASVAADWRAAFLPSKAVMARVDTARRSLPPPLACTVLLVSQEAIGRGSNRSAALERLAEWVEWASAGGARSLYVAADAALGEPSPRLAAALAAAGAPAMHTCTSLGGCEAASPATDALQPLVDIELCAAAASFEGPPGAALTQAVCAQRSDGCGERGGLEGAKP